LRGNETAAIPGQQRFPQAQTHLLLEDTPVLRQGAGGHQGMYPAKRTCLHHAVSRGQSVREACAAAQAGERKHARPRGASPRHGGAFLSQFASTPRGRAANRSIKFKASNPPPARTKHSHAPLIRSAQYDSRPISRGALNANQPASLLSSATILNAPDGDFAQALIHLPPGVCAGCTGMARPVESSTSSRERPDCPRSPATGISRKGREAGWIG